MAENTKLREWARTHFEADQEEIAVSSGKALVRRCAEIADAELNCDCGHTDDPKRYMYNTENGHSIDCPKQGVWAILREFGLEEKKS